MVETKAHPVGTENKADWLELTRPLAKRRPPSRPGQHVITMAGTVKRGVQIGAPVDVELELTDIEFHRLTSREAKSPQRCSCGIDQGPHITLLSVLFMPLSFVSSVCVSFYYSAMTWYNIYIYFSEEKTIWYKVFVCPVLIFSFPFWALLTAVGIGLYASVVQLSWLWDSWFYQIRDHEKGFYAWFCCIVQLPQCSPYEIVELDENEAFPDRS